MRISYAISVCSESAELDRLLTTLIKNKRDVDEIVVQFDLGNTTKEVFDVIDKHATNIKVAQCALKGNFAAFKNHLKSQCSGEWIFQIDADEYPTEPFIQSLHIILQDNPEIDLFLVPRINTVEGLTEDHVRRWRWNVNEKGWVNFPDYQTRILQNSPKIAWASKVHEVITGHRNYSAFPAEEVYCLNHPKTIARQEEQNHYYNTLTR